jgi:DNA repair protein RecO (recombination protein O)
MAAKRVGEEPAFILHRYDWSESSLILEVFTRHRGRVALLAKGVKRHTSNFRPVLLALQPLKVSYTLSGDGNADIHVLKGAEWAGGHIMPMGNNLLTGLYLNELLMRLLARDDPYAYLFDVYGAVVKLLATQPEEVIEPVLRAFELILLRELGLLPALELETQTLQALQPQTPYVLVAEMGLRPALDNDRAVLTGQQWLQLQSALEQEEAAYPALVRACATVAPALKPQLRHLLQYHCGSLLRTRQLMMDLQTL